MRRSGLVRGCSKVAALLVALCGTGPLPAAAPGGLGERNLQLSYLNVANGLSQDHVYDIVQDGRGFLWIATQEGLNRFDGYRVTTYEHFADRSETLSHDFVPVLLVDSSGTLWVGTANGVNRYDPESDEFDRSPFRGLSGDALDRSHVVDILEASDGSLWVATQDDGLVHVQTKSRRVTRYRHDGANAGSLPENAVLALMEDSRGDLWVGLQSEGLVRFDAVARTFVPLADLTDASVQGAEEVRALLEDRAGILWIGTGSAGVIRFDPRRQTMDQYRHEEGDPSSLGNDRVRDIVEDGDGTIWIATDRGLSEWRPEQRGFVTYVHEERGPGSLPSDHVNTLFTDRSGVLWIGTWNGVGKWNYRSDTFSYHNVANEQLPGDVVTSVAEDSRGTVWVATYGAGLARIDLALGQGVSYRHEPADTTSLPDDRVMVVHADPRDAIWVGTRGGGLARLDPDTGRFERFTHDAGRSTSLSSNAVTSIRTDGEGHLWVGTFGGGLNRTRVDDPGEFERYRFDQHDSRSISGDRVLTLYEDRSGTLWVGTDSDGLNRFDGVGTGFTRFGRFSSVVGQLILETVTSLTEDRNGGLWLGTIGQGLLHWNGQARASGTTEVQVYGKADGLPTETVYGILEDQKGALWFSSNRGLTRFHPADGSVRQFDSRSGLRENEFNQGASLRSRNGRLLFGSTAGLVSFFPGEVDINQEAPPVVVTANSRERALLTTGSREPMPRVEVSYLDRFVSFDFVALDFTSPDQNQYRYQLEGFDDAWIEGGSYRRATYTNLPPGEFTFRVQASNSDGVWNLDGAAVRVTVVPAPWNTWWAYAGYAGALSIFLAVFARSQRLKLRRESQQRALLEREVEARTEELASRNSELEALNTRLAEASVTDSLTGLRNRRYVDQYIASQVARFERERSRIASGGEPRRETGGSMFFMMIDLDGFKVINDRFGHYAGDQALTQVAGLLESTCRASDTLVRWGGDEFMVIGFASGLSGMKVLADRVREAVAEHPYDLGNGATGRLSASIGIAPYPMADERRWFFSWELVAGVADQAAYIAKANGRNAWVSIGGSENLDPEILEGLTAALSDLLDSGALHLDSSLEGPLVLPGDSAPARTAVG